MLIGDVEAASNSANIATENNLGPMMVGLLIAEAYLISQIDDGGSVSQGLEKIGKSEDDLGIFTQKVMKEGIELVFEKYPSETTSVFEILEQVVDAGETVITYVDVKTGNVVSTNYNALDESTKNQLKGGLGLVSIALTGNGILSIAKGVKDSIALEGAIKNGLKSSSELIANIIAPTVVSQKVAKIGWGKGIMGQGMPWENYLATKLGAETRLPGGFKTFDFYDKKTRVATSAKTLDTLTASRIKDPRKIANTLKKYIDDTLNFTLDTKFRTEVTRNMIKTMVIEVAIPNGTNIEQMKQIEKMVGYAKDKNVILNVVRIK